MFNDNYKWNLTFKNCESPCCTPVTYIIMYKEGWMPKNWCFWTMVLEKILESPLDWKRSNQLILKEINPKYSLEGLMLKLKLQYFGHLMGRANSLEKTLMLGKQRRTGWQRMRWLEGITDAMDMSWASSRRWWRTERPGVLQFLGLQRVGTRVSDWTTTVYQLYLIFFFFFSKKVVI